MSTRRFRLLATTVCLFALSAGASAAQTVSPYATPPSAAPVSVSSPFVVSWSDGWMLACLTFTNTSDRVIKAVRFAVTTTVDPLSEPSINAVDVVGSFAPGVAIKPPTKFLGTVNRVSPALSNCWPTPRFNVPATLDIAVLKVVYTDGSVWNAPTPQKLASVSY